MSEERSRMILGRQHLALNLARPRMKVLMKESARSFEGSNAKYRYLCLATDTRMTRRHTFMLSSSTAARCALISSSPERYLNSCESENVSLLSRKSSAITHPTLNTSIASVTVCCSSVFIFSFSPDEKNRSGAM